AVIHYTTFDATSGVSTPADFTFSDGSNLSHAGVTVTDVAGNTSLTTAGFTDIYQDTVAPTLTESINSPDATDWYNIATGHAGINVTDVAGNVSDTTAGFSGIKQDTVAPTLSASINSPAVTGWYNISTGPAVVTYSASDATSGVTTPSPFTFSDGAVQSSAA